MVNTINEARTPGELAAWLRQWADGADASDHLDDNDARQLAEAVERVCAPGSVAALRAALKICVHNMCEYCKEEASHHPGLAGKPCLDGCEALLLAKSALAAPARNCDVGTADEQAERFEAECHRHDHCTPCPVHRAWGEFKEGKPKSCQLIWAQMPYAPAEEDSWPLFDECRDMRDIVTNHIDYWCELYQKADAEEMRRPRELPDTLVFPAELAAAWNHIDENVDLEPLGATRTVMSASAAVNRFRTLADKSDNIAALRACVGWLADMLTSCLT